MTQHTRRCVLQVHTATVCDGCREQTSVEKDRKPTGPAQRLLTLGQWAALPIFSKIWRREYGQRRQERACSRPLFPDHTHRALTRF
jgi:hypothetical protein